MSKRRYQKVKYVLYEHEETRDAQEQGDKLHKNIVLRIDTEGEQLMDKEFYVVFECDDTQTQCKLQSTQGITRRLVDDGSQNGGRKRQRIDMERLTVHNGKSYLYLNKNTTLSLYSDLELSLNFTKGFSLAKREVYVGTEFKFDLDVHFPQSVQKDGQTIKDCDIHIDSYTEASHASFSWYCIFFLIATIINQSCKNVYPVSTPPTI